MSSKQSTSKTNPRLPQKDIMVTRHKSAQMKRQLRTKDRSMKHLTDLLKSPTKDTPTTQPATIPKSAQKPKTPPKLKQSLLKSVEKVQKLPEKVFKLSKVLRKKIALVEDEEFYPNKRKRTVEVKKVVLKPNHELKMVANIVGSVKRKCRVPHKATPKKPTTRAPSPYTQLSITEVIRIMDHRDELTDEDLMEILTCPSPVWWEAGPGDEYIEEAIFRRTPEPTPEPKKQEAVIKMEIDEERKPEEIKIPNLNKKSEKFLKKRSKLEGLLGNIKNKTNTKAQKSVNNNSNEARAVSSKNVFNEDIVVICSNYRKDLDKFKDKTSNNDKDKRNRNMSESDSDEVIFHNTSMNEDELLRDLENMEIPIENSKQNDVIVIDDDDDDIVEVTEEKKENLTLDEKINGEKIEMNDKNVPQNMPSLQKCENRDIVSPKSFESSSSKVSVNQDMDSISDTNIKFILDEENDEQSKTNETNEKAIAIKMENDINIKKESNLNKSMTVYRIVEEISDSKSTIKNIVMSKENNHEDKEKAIKINDYYKKCKKVYQKKEKTDINKNDLNVNRVKDECGSTKFIFCESCLPKTKKVSDDKNVKYCLKCSSIFDSDDCIYCLEKSKSNIYSCMPCKTKFCCQVIYKAHYMHMHTVQTNINTA